jgi:HD-GYP domain-containing protein (c-di-GMP phosphodiesterase class II)
MFKTNRKRIRTFATGTKYPESETRSGSSCGIKEKNGVLQHKEPFNIELYDFSNSSPAENIGEEHTYGIDSQRYLALVVASEEVPLVKRSRIVYDVTCNLLESLFASQGSKEDMAALKGIVSHTITLILSDRRSLRTLMAISSYDYYTYTHSVDVGVYAVGFGNYLGFSKEELKKLGYAAMMHDIGKSRIDDAIINKDGPLTGKEFEAIQKHPEYSYEFLCYHGEEDQDILDGVRYHHEKHNGTGYPKRMCGDEIPIFAQIIAISDVFSALTTNRSYKKALSTFESLSLMKNTMQDKLGNKLLMQFIRFIGENSI